MIYLLDANVLITAHHLYYPVDAVPEFWEWLAHQGVAGQIKMPVETFEEVKDGGTDAERDMLYAWVQEDAPKLAFSSAGTGRKSPRLNPNPLITISIPAYS